MAELIVLGGLALRYPQDTPPKDGLDLFEMTVQPNARMPIAHYHESWDETVYGLSGTCTFRVAGVDVDIGPGDSLSIPRGVVHGFTNRMAAEARCLIVISPAVLDRAYFREIAGLLASGAPDPAAMKAIMLRHGLVPVPPPG